MNYDEKIKIYNDMMSDSKVLDEAKSLPQPVSLDEMSQVLGGLSAKNGYPLSKEDFQDIFEERKKRTDMVAATTDLSDSELLSVTGGACTKNPIIIDADAPEQLPADCGLLNAMTMLDLGGTLGGGFFNPPGGSDVILQ